VYEFLNQHPSYAYALPAFFVTAAGMLLLAVDLVAGGKGTKFTGALGIALLAATAAMLYCPPAVNVSQVSGLIKEMLSMDAYARFFGVMFCAIGILVILMSFSFKPLKKFMGEYYSLIVICTGAFLFLASATNLLMVYLCIEFIGITSYILAAYMKSDPRSGEGALKYLLTGGVASAFMVYGMSLLYGFTGSLNIYVIGAAIAGGAAPSPAAVYAGFVLVLVGFGFKIAAAPFHMWAPDAYEGAPTPVTAFFSAAPKAAGIAVMMRVFLAVFPVTIVNWVPVLTVISIVTMTLGNVIAIWQTNVKRMMAYSSIAHVGYMLMGLVVVGHAGVNTAAGRAGLFATMFYVVAYVITNLGVFAAIIIASNALGTDDLKYYNGLGRRAPFAATCLTFLLLSLGGVPPTAGFVGKFFLFMGAINTGFYILAFFLAANAVISIFYYWGIVRRMFIDPPSDSSRVHAAAPLALTLFLTSAAVLALAIFFQPLMHYVTKSLL
jgi:proton-translocating NADH-quinone oxidoreductase chain N